MKGIGQVGQSSGRGEGGDHSSGQAGVCRAGLRGLRQVCRDRAGRALVRDTGKKDRHKDEQQPVRAGEPKGRLGPGQKGTNQAMARARSRPQKP